MVSINRAEILGHLGADPDIRSTQSGNKVASFSVATSEQWKDKTTGEKKEATEWHRVTVWGDGIVEKVIEPHLKKGSRVLVVGQLRTRKWQDQNNIDRYTTEIVCSGFDSKVILLGDSKGGRMPAPDDPGEAPPGATGGKSYELDDDIPF